MNLGHSATGLAALTIVLACAGRAQEPHAAGRQDAGRNFMPAKRLTAAQKLQLVQDTLKIRPSKLAEIAAILTERGLGGDNLMGVAAARQGHVQQRPGQQGPDQSFPVPAGRGSVAAHPYCARLG